MQGDMCGCPQLNVLYLYDNKLERMGTLDFCSNLTHLYLQNNRLKQIEGLELLPRLQKL
ncbi:hypothetical protein RvY_12060 [Ramazzottius varieornatus]|uniref:Uncharacterized protein n=1 Tax=Ramazzottius varieornatus TaxID=947166 RepID=A0A1D1VI91_RAMVA|nr:hypothetical protein RvY_12060 [Ramazzottius varieornatus]